jgi:hypothetical protein
MAIVNAWKRWGVLAAVLVASVWSVGLDAQNAGGRGAPAGAAGQVQTARGGALIDLTGYWVSVVTEDWRFRMVTPAKGDFQGVPMNAAAAKVANNWDPDADQKAGLACKSYGAPAIMRVPGRLHVTWQDDTTLRFDFDAGTQTRLFRFAGGPPSPPQAAKPQATKAEASWQGDSIARWEQPAGRGRGPGTGSLKVTTTNLRTGYLRKNGVPYSEHAQLTEYFDVVQERNGTPWLVVTTVVDDPQYLNQPFITSTQFKKQADASGWEPSPCSSVW